MSEAYEEIIAGESWLRLPPGGRHEQVCRRLHAAVAVATAGSTGLRQLAPRSLVRLGPTAALRPDLALVDPVSGELRLAAEVISPGDHHPDTVLKKQVYEEVPIPRVWMVDPRYHNVEIYTRQEVGLVLSRILALSECLCEPQLPGLQLNLAELFAP